MEKTICELFAGVGGFRIGFERADKEYKTVWFSQYEPSKKEQHAYKCYVEHFGNIDENTNKDITSVNKADIPKHNILVGGFPCQDYSVAHTLASATGIEGKKGVLWWDIYAILKEKQPAFVLLENVDRLIKSPAKQRGRDFGIMLSCFAECGYDVEWRIVNAAEYGAVQRRKRTYIFAYKRDTAYAKQLEQKGVIQIINTDGLFAKVFAIKPIDAKDIKEQVLEYTDILTVSETFRCSFENSGIFQNGTVYTIKTEAQANIVGKLRDILEDTVAEKYYVTDDKQGKWKYLKGAKKFQRTNKDGFEYTYSEGAMSFPDNIDLPARTMLTSEGSINRCSHIIEDPQTKRLRILTPIEVERINGFPDNWTAHMPERMRYFVMGNALVVDMITAMAKELSKIIDIE